MIFKTFDSDSDKFISKIGILNRSFEQWGESIRARKIDIDNLMSAGLVSSEKEAKNQVGSLWSYLYGNKSVKQMPIDLSLFDNFNASTTLKGLQDIETSVENGDTTWQKYFSTLDDGRKWQVEFVQNNDLSKVSLEQVENAQKAARESALAYNNGLKQMTLGAKAANVALKALSVAGNMLVMFAVIKGIELIAKGIDELIHGAENAQKRIDDLSEEFSDGVSKLNGYSSELDSVNQKITELQSKGKLSFTDSEELKKLTQQRVELERQLEVQEKLNAAKANEVVTEIRNNTDKLNENFETDLGNYTEKLEILERTKKNGLKLLESGSIDQEHYDETIQIEEDRLSTFYSAILEDVENFEKNRQSILDKYNGDVSKMTKSDAELFELITQNLNKAYESIYSKSEYNQIVIEPIFDTDELQGLQQEITDYFINNGSLDVKVLEEKFGTSLIEALRVACENAGIELDYLLQQLYDQAQETSYGFAPIIKNPNSAYEAKQNSNSQSKINYYNNLDDETKKIIIEAEIPDSVKNGTLEEFKTWITTLQDEANINVDFTLSNQSESIDSFQEKLNTLSSALQKINSGEMDTSSMMDLFQKFPELEGHTDDLTQAINNLAKNDLNTLIPDMEAQGAPQYIINMLKDMTNEALNTSASIDDLEETIQKLNALQIDLSKLNKNGISALTDDMISEISSFGGKYKELVNEYLIGGIDGQTFIDNLASLYDTDFKNYSNYILAKYANSETFWTNIVKANKDMIDSFSEDYGVDISNCRTYAEAKLRIETELANKVQSMWASVYANIQANQGRLEGMPSYIQDMYKNKGIQSQNNPKLDAALADLNNIAYTGISSGLGDIASGFKKVGDSAKSSASESKDSYEELFDFFERRVDVLNDALDLLNSNLENVIGASGKNKLIDAEIGINKESINNYTDALAMYQSKAAEALSKIPADLQKKIVDGAVSLVDFVGSGNEDVVDAIKDYQNWADKVSDCKKELAGLKETLRQLELDKFNNIVEQFTNQFDITTNAQGLIQKQIDLFEEAGQLIGEGFYHGLINESNSQLNILQQERENLVNEMNNAINSGLIEVGTDEWLEMVNSLNEVDGSILDCKKDIEEFNNAIQNLHWEIIEKIQNNFDDLSDEISNLIGLIDDIDVSDVEGNWSKEGLTQLGLLAQQYERAMYSADMYSKEIDELNAAYLRGEYSAIEYADKLAELKQSQWDEINASEEAKDAIFYLNKARVEIMIDGIEKEIDAMKELIEAKKEALDAEQDLYEYRQSITEKNKSVTDLEKQIAAMQNDTTASTVAKRKKLEEQLKEAKQDLADFEYNHSIETQKEALDKQYDEFETEKNAEIDALNETLNDKEALISASFERIKANTELIGQQIDMIALTHGANVSGALINSWKSGENAIASYGSVLNAHTSSFVGNLGTMVGSVYNLQSQANSTSVSLTNMYNTSSANLQAELLNSYYSVANLNAVTQVLNDSLINTLSRGYDVSSIVNSLNSVGDAASSAANQVAGLMSALAGTGNTGGYTYSDKYQNGSNNKNNIVTVYDKNGNVVEVTTKDNAEKKYKDNGGITLRKYAKGGIVTKDDSNPLNYLAKSVGEDTLVAAKDGESILTKAQTDGFLKLVDKIDFSKFKPLENIPWIASSTPNIPEFNNKNSVPITMRIDNLVNIEGNVNDNEYLLKQISSGAKQAVNDSLKQLDRELRKSGVH